MTLAADGFAAIVAKLKQRGSYRPRSFKTSSSTVASLLQKVLTRGTGREVAEMARRKAY
jgi:hypothetical protein